MHLSSFNAFDWILVAFLAASTVRAFLRGFILEVFSIVGLIAGMLIASWNYPLLASHLVSWTATLARLPYATAEIAAFSLLVVGIMVLSGLLGRLLRSGAGAIGLGLVDRLGGAAFGLARGCLLAVAGTVALTAFAPDTRLVGNSQLFPYFLAGAHGVSFVVPETLQRQLLGGAARIKHNASLWIKPGR